MRTNIDIDDELMRSAMAATGLRTKKAVVEEALKLLVRLKGQEKIRDLRGKLTAGRATSTTCGLIDSRNRQ